MSESSIKDRLEWIDLAKGIAIVLVSAGHTWRGLHASGSIPQSLFEAIDSRIYAYHMPVFFVASGLFFIQTLTKVDEFTFIAQRFRRLFWPMLLWAYIFVGLRALAGSNANSPAVLQDLFFLPIPGYLHLWFLWALLLISLILLPLKYLVQRGKIATPILVALLVGSIGLQSIPLSSGVTYWLGSTFTFMPYFLIGIIMRQVNFDTHITPNLSRMAVVLFVAILAFWPEISEIDNVFFLKAILTVCFYAFCCNLPKILNTSVMRGLIVLGTSTMVIYLTHTIFCASVRSALFIADVQNLWAHLILGTAAGLLFPITILAFAKATKTERLLGF